MRSIWEIQQLYLVQRYKAGFREKRKVLTMMNAMLYYTQAAKFRARPQGCYWLFLRVSYRALMGEIDEINKNYNLRSVFSDFECHGHGEVLI